MTTTTTTTTTLDFGRTGYFTQRSLYDWLFALAVLLGGIGVFSRYGASMDGYEKPIFAGVLPALVALGWFWGRLRGLTIGVAAAALVAIELYQQHLDGVGAVLS